MDLREQIVADARAHKGISYDVLDCSAFVRHILNTHHGCSLPRVSDDQAKYFFDRGLAYKISKELTKEQIIPMLEIASVVWWSSSSAKNRYLDIHHVGFHAGNGMMIESSSSRGKVVERPLWETKKWQVVMIGDPIPLIKQEAKEMLTKDSNPKLIAEFQQELIDIGAGGNMNAELVAAVLAGENDGKNLWGSKTDDAIRAFKVAHGLAADTVVDESVHLAIGAEYRAIVAEYEASAQKDLEAFGAIAEITQDRLNN